MRNYTSSTPAERSVSYIESKLVAYGASNIVKRYGGDRRLVAIMFQIQHGPMLVPVRLPANVEAVYQVFKRKMSRPTEASLANARAQAERTAWKIMADWVDIQFTMVELGQAEFLEIFLPYVWFPAAEQTLFGAMKGGGFKMLTSGTGVPA